MVDAAVATRALIAMLTGITAWYRPDGRLTIETVEDICVDMARASLGIHPLADTSAPATIGRTEPCTTADCGSA